MENQPKPVQEPRLKRLELENFTAFRRLKLDFVTGANVFIGANSTGKTHVLKALYAAVKALNDEPMFYGRIFPQIFLPYKKSSELIHNHHPTDCLSIKTFFHGDGKIEWSFSRLIENKNLGGRGERRRPVLEDQDSKLKAVFIPAKEMISHAPGFRSLYERREIRFDATYKDILDSADQPSLRNLTEDEREILAAIKAAIGGDVLKHEEHFFLKKDDLEIEMGQVAEGYRKLALLWLLIRNGEISKDSILFWDEPEANLNPKLMRQVVGILLDLQRMGTQIFLATHEYTLLKEFDLQKREDDAVRFFSLFPDEETKAIKCKTTDDYYQIEPNVITDTYLDIYERDIERGLQRTRK